MSHLILKAKGPRKKLQSRGDAGGKTEKIAVAVFPPKKTGEDL